MSLVILNLIRKPEIIGFEFTERQEVWRALYHNKYFYWKQFGEIPSV